MSCPLHDQLLIIASLKEVCCGGHSKGMVGLEVYSTSTFADSSHCTIQLAMPVRST